MKTRIAFRAGRLLVVIRSDGGIYIGDSGPGDLIMNNAIRIGSSATICDALADALREAAKYLRLPREGNP